MKSLIITAALLVLAVPAAAAKQPIPTVVLRDIYALHKAYFLCYQADPAQHPAEEIKKACPTVDQLLKKLKTQGYCGIGHIGVGRSSKDGKHCYAMHYPIPQ